MDQKFGVLPKHHRNLTDRPHKLSPRETEETQQVLSYFERKFPQSVFSVYITELPAGTAIGEYHFWLFNRGRFFAAQPGSGIGQNFNVLLLIDSVAGAAALGLGYALEPYVSEEDLALVLQEARPAFARGDLGRAIRLCVEATMRRMREVARQVEVPTRLPAMSLRRGSSFDPAESK